MYKMKYYGKWDLTYSLILAKFCLYKNNWKITINIGTREIFAPRALGLIIISKMVFDVKIIF